MIDIFDDMWACDALGATEMKHEIQCNICSYCTVSNALTYLQHGATHP